MSDPTNTSVAESGPEPTALVTPEWLEANRHRDIRLIEIAGMGQDDLSAYKAGHVPGAAAWKWKEALWDARMREFPSPEEFAREKRRLLGE